MIPQSQVLYGSPSLIDDGGRIFFWNGGIYRAIHPKYANFYRELLERNVLNDLFDKRLVRTIIAPQSLEGYELTLQHQRVPFVSYCPEWSAEMLRDAALFYCDLVADLDARGLGLKDAHPWNVLFDCGYPVFVDFGSIVAGRNWRAHVYKEFQNWFVMPLLLMSAGLSRLARTLMLNPGNPPSSRDVLRLLIRRVPLNRWLQYWLNLRRLQSIAVQDGAKAFASARKLVKSIPINSETTEWTNYRGPGEIYSIDTPGEWNAKSLNVQSILQRLKPDTVIDIGCNRGWFSDLAVSAGTQVVAVDLDEPNINALYQRVRVSRTLILPLLMDVCRPTPSHAYAFPGASARLKSDLALALAITHHLVFKRLFSFEFIAEILSTFSKRWLIVEFVPPEDQYVREWMSDKFAWYCLNGFMKALERYFQHIEIVGSSPSPRVLLICEK